MFKFILYYKTENLFEKKKQKNSMLRFLVLLVRLLFFVWRYILQECYRLYKITVYFLNNEITIIISAMQLLSEEPRKSQIYKVFLPALL